MKDVYIKHTCFSCGHAFIETLKGDHTLVKQYICLKGIDSHGYGHHMNSERVDSKDMKISIKAGLCKD